MTKTLLVVGLMGLTVMSPAAFAGPDWLEQGDAGAVLSSAQVTRGVGQLRTISGEFSSAFGGGDSEDMYLIRVTDPATFRLSISSATFDTQMFLFNVTQADEAFGLLGNLDRGSENDAPLLTPIATDGTGARLTNPGVYAVAIALASRVPVSRTGGIFSFASSTELSGPDGPGAVNPHQGWTGTATGGGPYIIDVDGATFVEVPTPGAAGLLAISGLMLFRRRR